ncbi:MAG: cytidylyltransferase domain-containing protein [Bacteroidota bacterium]
MAKVVGIIGARLNSSRLPGKHLLDLAGRPVIARIFERLERLPEIDRLVLATTADDYNRPLVDWADAHGKAVFAFGGDVNDLVGRVDAVVQAENPDIVVYFCGDSPLMEPVTVSALIQACLNDPAADWAVLAPPASGRYIHEGFTVYPRPLWDRIAAESRSADDREHVGSAVWRFVDQLRCLQVPDDPVYTRREQRISVDTPSDYAFMGEVYRRWYAGNPADSIVSLRWVIDMLERDPALAAINAQVRQKAVGEHSQPVLLVCHTGPGVGLGHLSRILAVARALQDRHFAAVHLLIQGAPVVRGDLSMIPHRFIAMDADLLGAMAEDVAAFSAKALVLDLHGAHVPAGLADFLAARPRVARVGIDSTWPLAADLDLVCLPGFFVAEDVLRACGDTPVLHGWPHYLLRPCPPRPPWQPGQRVLVLTGGSDATGLGDSLPAQLDAALPADTELHWVQGPYAAAPQVPAPARLSWQVHHAPDDLGPLMAQCQYALTIYGVSVFELLGHGVPTVVFSPYDGRDEGEMAALRGEAVARVADDAAAALSAVVDLMTDATAAAALAAAGPGKVDGQGPARLADRVHALMAALP